MGEPFLHLFILSNRKSVIQHMSYFLLLLRPCPMSFTIFLPRLSYPKLAHESNGCLQVTTVSSADLAHAEAFSLKADHTKRVRHQSEYLEETIIPLVLPVAGLQVIPYRVSKAPMGTHARGVPGYPLLAHKKRNAPE